MPTLAIVIVNWNTKDQLQECLESIASAKNSSFELKSVIVVDNASTDDSLSCLRVQKLPLRIIRNDRNYGFGAACNIGAMGCDADYLLFLNPDARLFEDSLHVPIAFMEKAENRNIAVCGPQLVDEKGNISRGCTRYPNAWMFISQILGLNMLFPGRFKGHFMNEWDHRDSRIVDHVIGAFYLIRRDVFEAHNGFDERFFVYLEDLDLSYRIFRSGYRTYYMADARAYHKGGGASEQIRAKRLFYALRSRVLYAFKHFDPFSAVSLLLATIIIEPVTRLIKALFGASFSQIYETIIAYLMLWFWIISRSFAPRKKVRFEDTVA